MPGMVMPGDDNSSGSAPVNAKPADSNDMSGMDMGSGSGKAKTEHQMVKVSGNCEMCKDRIETAAKSLAGVTSAEWSAENKMLHVQFDAGRTNLDDIQKAIAKVGHDTEKFKASDAAYKTLPECCLYRK